MNKLSRTGLIAMAIIISLLLGAYFGYKTSNEQAFAEDIIILAKQHQFIEIAKNNGTDEAYEESLLGYLNILDALEGKRSSLFSEDVHAIDYALTHTRLALLSEKRGDLKGKAQHLQSAESYCPKTVMTTCTGEVLTEIVIKLDNNIY